MFDFIARWLGGGARPTETRLQKEEVLAIARQHASTEAERDELVMVSLVEQNGRRVWIVGQAVRGRRLVVSIDDATGEVCDVRHTGVR